MAVKLRERGHLSCVYVCISDEVKKIQKVKVSPFYMIFPNSENTGEHTNCSKQAAENRCQPAVPSEEPNSSVSRPGRKRESKSEVLRESCIW